MTGHDACVHGLMSDSKSHAKPPTHAKPTTLAQPTYDMLPRIAMTRKIVCAFLFLLGARRLLDGSLVGKHQWSGVCAAVRASGQPRRAHHPALDVRRAPASCELAPGSCCRYCQPPHAVSIPAA